MPSTSTEEARAEARKVGEQAAAFISAAAEQARTSLLAALGAGDLAAKAMAEALGKARQKFKERTGDLNDLGSLREQLDPAQLRKLLDTYTGAAANLYHYLAEHGEQTFERLKEQPAVKRVFDQAEAAQEHAEAAVDEAEAVSDAVLGKPVASSRQRKSSTTPAGAVQPKVRKATPDSSKDK